MRPRPLVLVAGGLALVAVLLVGILIGRSGDDGSAAPPVVPPPLPSTSTSGASVPGTAPASPEPTPTLATLGPVDTEMYDVPGGLRLPRSPSAGPTNTDNFLASGFAHTPLGAVVAAVNIAARTNGYLGEPIYRPTIERQVVGPDQQAVLRRAERTGQRQIPGPEDRVEDANVRIYGFTIDAYNPEESTVSYLLVGPVDGTITHVVIQVTMRWADDDWRLVAPASGDFSARSRIVNNPDAFHKFA